MTYHKGLEARIQTQVCLALKHFLLWAFISLCGTRLCQPEYWHFRKRNFKSTILMLLFSPAAACQLSHNIVDNSDLFCSDKIFIIVQFLSSNFFSPKCEQRLQMHAQTVRIKLIKIHSLQ